MGMIQTELRLNDFFMVAGTTERARGCLSEDLVGRGTPLTWDINNGLMVIYDDIGMPWIRCTRWVTRNWEEEFVEHHKLTRGARVPHSNDGGTFKQLMFEQIGISV